MILYLIIGLLFLSCGRSTVPQQSNTVHSDINHREVPNHVPDPIIISGDDCSRFQAVLDNNVGRLIKCESEVDLLVQENENLKDALNKSGKKVKIKNSFNVDNSQIIRLRNSNQILAQDNARLQADSAVMAGKIKDVIKHSGNTKSKDRFWLGVLVASAVFQGIRLLKRYALKLPKGQILSKILSVIA